MSDDETKILPCQTEQDLVEAIGALARSYSLLRRTDQESKYEFSDIAEAIKRLAKQIGVK